MKIELQWLSIHFLNKLICDIYMGKLEGNVATPAKPKLYKFRRWSLIEGGNNLDDLYYDMNNLHSITQKVILL